MCGRYRAQQVVLLKLAVRRSRNVNHIGRFPGDFFRLKFTESHRRISPLFYAPRLICLSAPLTYHDDKNTRECSRGICGRREHAIVPCRVSSRTYFFDVFGMRTVALSLDGQCHRKPVCNRLSCVWRQLVPTRRWQKKRGNPESRFSRSFLMDKVIHKAFTARRSQTMELSAIALKNIQHEIHNRKKYMILD